MGNGCSCSKTLLFCSLKSEENENGREAEKIENRNDGKTSTETRTGTFKEAVKSTVDIDPCEKDETVILKVKEIKVLPPIRNKSNTLPHISYRPNRVWGGSVGSFLDTIKRDSIVDEDIITGRQIYTSFKLFKVKRAFQQLNQFLWGESLLYDAFLIVASANNKEITNTMFSRVKEYLRLLFFLILGNYPSILP